MRLAMVLLCTLLLAGQSWAASWLPRQQPSLLQQHWDSFRHCFIDPTGRVIDTGNGHISHSEGQGYAMLAASAVGSEAQFEQLWSWTRQHLQQRRDDQLLIWQWQPKAPHTPDLNNASDGDIAVAWALLRGAQRWQRSQWQQQALQLLAAIEQHLLRTQGEQVLLLPGIDGFSHDDGHEYNLAYWLYPALRSFAQHQPKGPWQPLIDAGLQLLRDSSQANELGLPADWLLLSHDNQLQQQGERRGRFGFEAIRIPLYLCWANACEQLPDSVRYWLARQPQPPAWIRLDGQQQASYPLSPGAMQIRELVLTGRSTAPPAQCTPEQPGDYYSAVLALLAVMASDEQRNAP